MEKRTCDAIIVCCIDFRFQNYIRQWTDKNLANKTFDLVGYAGSTKNLKTIMSQVDIAVLLHDIKKVILINHEECGAYGEESTWDNHCRDLKNTKKSILAIYSDLEVELYYLHLNGEFEAIKT